MPDTLLENIIFLYRKNLFTIIKFLISAKSSKTHCFEPDKSLKQSLFPSPPLCDDYGEQE